MYQSASRPLSVLFKIKEILKRKIKDDGHWIFQWKIK